MNEVFSDCRAYLKWKIPNLKDYLDSKKQISMEEIIEIDNAVIEDEKVFKLKVEEETQNENEIKFKKEQIHIPVLQDEHEIILIE